MPIRFGFAQHRRRLLQEELAHVVDILPNLNVKQVILYVDMAKGKVGPSSNIQLLCIHETDAPFISRIDFFINHIQPRVGLDVLVYTPKEFEEMKTSSPFMKHVLSQGKVIYEQ